MKTIFIKKLSTLALSVFALGSFAQCPTINGFYSQQGTGTATVAAIMTPSTSIGTGYFNWTVSPSAYMTPMPGTNNSMQELAFNATGIYTICAYYIDSTTMCSASTCTTINVMSVASSSCNAAFTHSTSSCVTSFYSTSTGINLTYEWRNMSTFPFPVLSTQNTFTTSLPAGNNLIALYVYSNGQFCDSTVHTVAGCATNTCQANSQFTVFADSSHAGSYFAYNQSSGSGTLSYLWNFGDGTTSTQAYPFHQYATPGQYIICLTVTNTSGSVTCTDISCDSSSVHRIASGYFMSSIQVVPQGPTAVKEQQALKNLNVYPNPVENELTIDLEPATEQQHLSYVITDALGKVVAKNELTSSKTTVNTATLDRGIYFLSVSESVKVLKTIKLIK